MFKIRNPLRLILELFICNYTVGHKNIWLYRFSIFYEILYISNKKVLDINFKHIHIYVFIISFYNDKLKIVWEENRMVKNHMLKLWNIFGTNCISELCYMYKKFKNLCIMYSENDLYS